MNKVNRFSRIICVVLDGVGIGELPDAAAYGDVGSNSLGNTARLVGSISLPVLGRLGLGNILDIDGVPPADRPAGFYGRMQPRSPGKDSTSGHWELMGCILDRALPVYPDGFPKAIVKRFEAAIGREVLGNVPASGTEIILDLGDEHLETGRPILYTSQDSVFQLAAHEDIIPLEELYRWCETARAQLVGPDEVGRVIARPFLGTSGRYYRSPRRKDYSVAPPARTVLDVLSDGGIPVTTIGKIDDLFTGRGISAAIHTRNNTEGMEATLDCIRRRTGGFIFTNLLDFDTMWGHRNDARAYALGLEEFDAFTGELLDTVAESDLVIITSDHGNDPTTTSTDHSREYVPLLVPAGAGGWGSGLGLRTSLCDVGKTILDNFGLAGDMPGDSFLGDIIQSN